MLDEMSELNFMDKILYWLDKDLGLGSGSICR